MTTSSPLLSHSTRGRVGLGLSTVFLGLGTLSLFAPNAAADALNVRPTTPEGQTITKKAMGFLGVRDVAVAGSLLWFYRGNQLKEMGVLMSSWTLVCVVDTYIAAQDAGPEQKGMLQLYVGAVLVAATGWGLLLG